MGDIADDPSAHQRDGTDKYHDQQSDCPWKASLSVPLHGLLPYFLFSYGIHKRRMILFRQIPIKQNQTIIPCIPYRN